MAGLLQRAWDWLTPPELPLVDGQLVKRQRRGSPLSPASPGSADSAPLLAQQAVLDGFEPLANFRAERAVHPPSPPFTLSLSKGVSGQATEDESNMPSPDPASVPGGGRPAAFVHPRASHQLQLCGVEVGYLLERSRRRSVGMTVCSQGLRVRAPLGVSLGAVERVLRDKADWIVRKLAEQRGLEVQSACLQWGAQTVLPYLGAALRVALVTPLPGAAAAQLQPAQGVLQLSLAAHGPADQVRSRVHAWWLHAARSHFTERLNHFAPLLGVHWRSLGLSSARTRWGSARSDGAIRLNWRLLHYAPEVIDYVVVHELSHLRHMDHSPRFWATVASVLPDYRLLRQQLRDQPAPRWSDDDV